MLRPIPSKILTHSATLKICTGVDDWQNPTFRTIPLSHICIQNEFKTVKTREDTEVRTTGILFHDARLSSPSLDFDSLQRESEANGHPLRVVFGNTDHIVLTVDSVIDDEGNLHHTELTLD